MSLINEVKAWLTEAPNGFQWLRVLAKLNTEDLELVPIIFDVGANATLVKHENASTVSGLAEVVLIDETVPVLKLRKYYGINVVCRRQGKITVFANGNLVGSGRTGPASPNVKILLMPVETLNAGQKIEVKFKPSLNSSTSADIEAFVRGIERATT